jgi:hypothetical protein
VQGEVRYYKVHAFRKAANNTNTLHSGSVTNPCRVLNEPIKGEKVTAKVGSEV